jgi:CubicO group peptidase (beta-lactamase class C family)
MCSAEIPRRRALRYSEDPDSSGAKCQLRRTSLPITRISAEQDECSTKPRRPAESNAPPRRQGAKKRKLPTKGHEGARIRGDGHPLLLFVTLRVPSWAVLLCVLAAIFFALRSAEKVDRYNFVMLNNGSLLPQALAEIESGMKAQLHIGAQVFVWRAGNVVADLGLGEARPGVAMRADILMPWMSATKPIVAIGIGQLWERGLLKLDDRVERHIPEFGKNGKEAITIRHLLTHTAGFRGAVGTWTTEPFEITIQKICDARIEPGWTPGKKAGYHVASSWFVLGELIQRLSGTPFQEYIRREIFIPLNMNDSWIGLPGEQYAAYGDRIGILHDTAGGIVKPSGLDTPEKAAVCRPGGSGRGPARELGRFYQMLLMGGSLDGVRIVSPQTVAAMTARHRVGMFDHTFKHVMDWGLGFIVNSNQYGIDTVPYGYGPHASWRTFGHSGYQSSVAFADPKNELVVAIVFNGTPGEAEHDQRVRNVLSALYTDLGLA